MRIAVVTVKKSLVNLGSPKEFDACDTSGSLPKIAGGRQSVLKWLITTLRMGQYHYPQPIKLCVAQFGRVLALGARCCRFKSCRKDHKKVTQQLFNSKIFKKQFG